MAVTKYNVVYRSGAAASSPVPSYYTCSTVAEITGAVAADLAYEISNSRVMWYNGTAWTAMSGAAGNYALLDANNTWAVAGQRDERWTASGYIRFGLTDNSQPSGSRSWDFLNISQTFQIRALNDNFSALTSTPISCARDGSVTIGGVLTTGRVTNIAGISPFLGLADNSQVADSRLFIIQNSGLVLGIRAYNDAATVLQATPISCTRTGDVTIGGMLIIGPNAASAGGQNWDIRLKNASTIGFRNNANNGDIAAFQMWTDNKIYVGAPTGDAGLILRSSVQISVSGPLYITKVIEQFGAATLSGGVLSVNIVNGMNWYVVLNQNVTSLSISGITGGFSQTVLIRIRQDGTGGRTVAIHNPATGYYVQPGWTMTARANATDILICFYDPNLGVWLIAPFATGLT